MINSTASELSIEREIHRKIIHILLGSSAIIFYYYNLVNALIVLLLVLITFFGLLILNMTNVKFLSSLVRYLSREESRLKGIGALTFGMGIFLAIFLFRKNIALASISILTFGDSMSNLYGRLIGKTSLAWNPLKNAEGLIFSILFSSIIASFFVNPIYAIIASALSLIIEGFHLSIDKMSVDDNILIPIIAGTILLLLKGYFPF